jgi:hypothetical protein
VTPSPAQWTTRLIYSTKRGATTTGRAREVVVAMVGAVAKALGTVLATPARVIFNLIGAIQTLMKASFSRRLCQASNPDLGLDREELACSHNRLNPS